jgi:hypothetical protein
VFAKFEKDATVVPLSTEPTPTAEEMQAGVVIFPVSPPLLAATATATPFWRSMSTTERRGSSSQYPSREEPPMERFTAAILYSIAFSLT